MGIVPAGQVAKAEIDTPPGAKLRAVPRRRSRRKLAIGSKVQVRTALGAATVKRVRTMREAKPRVAHRRPRSGMMVLRVAREAMPHAALGHRSDRMTNQRAAHRRPKSEMMVLRVARVAMPHAALGHRSRRMKNTLDQM